MHALRRLFSFLLPLRPLQLLGVAVGEAHLDACTGREADGIRQDYPARISVRFSSTSTSARDPRERGMTRCHCSSETLGQRQAHRRCMTMCARMLDELNIKYA